MLRLIWLDEARRDLRDLISYVSERDAFAAERLNSKIHEADERVTQFLYMYRQGRVPNTREAVVHPNYIIIYRVRFETVEIVSVIHARQQYP